MANGYVNSPGLNPTAAKRYTKAVADQPAAYGPGNPAVEQAGFGNAEANLGNGSSSSSSAPTATPEVAKLPDMDWASTFFASLGLPPDVVNKVNQIFTQYSDVNTASAAALGYIRGTPWYAQTYPGIQAGIAKGLVANEQDYRQLLNSQNQIYRQYLGRDVTGSEFANSLTAGESLSTVGGRLQGAALANTYGNDWRYQLGAFDTAPTDAEVKALGEEQAGLDSPLGQMLKRRLDLAQQRMQGVFRGTLATPSLSLNNGKLFAPGLSASPQNDYAA